MPYVTLMQSPQYHQVSFEDILFGKVDSVGMMLNRNTTNTRTVFTSELKPEFVAKFDIKGMTLALKEFCQKHEKLYEVPRKSLYNTFPIPKRSGGIRIINAPHYELSNALRELKQVLEDKCFALYHTSAFAYIHGRSTIDAVKRHQRNDSHWFLKTDFSDFFGSTTLKFTMEMLGMIFPFSEIVKTEEGAKYLRRALSLAFLDNGLPQGTPISPMLTNLVMIPIDHRLYNCLRDYKGKTYVVTRYADDMLISSREKFDYKEIVQFINDTLKGFNAPFKIKDAKTRFGSRAGSNWNLGMMLNKDNEITIGWKNKQRFRAMISNYILDRKNGKPWELHEVQVLRGLVNYYNMIEPAYVSEVLAFNNNKYGADILRSMAEDMAIL